MTKAQLLIKSKNNDYYEFYIEGVDVHILNSIRRVILSETVTLAIHDVYIYQNTSVLPDEMLAQRLALVPLRVDPSELNLLEEASAVRPDLRRLLKFTARLRLRKLYIPKQKEKVFTGTKLKDIGIITVYSGDLESIDKKTLRPVYGDIPLVKLGPYQEVEVECVAKVGRGKDHAKFSPVSTVAYKVFPRIKVYDSCDSCGICIDVCPFNSLKMELGKPILRGEGLYTCTLCRICQRSCPRKAIEIEPDYSRYLFRIKLVGQLTIDEILDQVEAIFNNRLDFIFEKIEEQLSAEEGIAEEKGDKE